MLYFFEAGKNIQIVAVLVVCNAYAMLTAYIKPYVGTRNNPYAVLAQGQLSLTLLCGMLIKLELPIIGQDYNWEEESEIITWVVIVSSLSALAYGLFALMLEAKGAQARFIEEALRRRQHTILFRKTSQRSLNRMASGRTDASSSSSDDEALTIESSRGDAATKRQLARLIGDGGARKKETVKKRKGGKKGLTREQEEQLTRFFNDADDNGNGTVEYDEMRLITEMLSEPLGDDELDAIMSLLDPHNTGSIPFPKFIAWWKGDVIDHDAVTPGSGGMSIDMRM
jgi:hypothetical protein